MFMLLLIEKVDLFIEILYYLKDKTPSLLIERFMHNFKCLILRILTDNGFEWSDRCTREIKEKSTGLHPVDILCRKHNIKHVLTKIRRPQTNGMVERFNRRINEAINMKTKVSRNCSFSSHDERNSFINDFVFNYNRTRLICLKYNSQIEILNDNLTEPYNIHYSKKTYFQSLFIIMIINLN